MGILLLGSDIPVSGNLRAPWDLPWASYVSVACWASGICPATRGCPSKPRGRNNKVQHTKNQRQQRSHLISRQESFFNLKGRGPHVRTAIRGHGAIHVEFYVRPQRGPATHTTPSFFGCLRKSRGLKDPRFEGRQVFSHI